MTSPLHSLSSKYRTWCANAALPFWIANGQDARRGGWYSILDANGAPIPGRNRQISTQFYQAYVYAHSDVLGWMRNAKQQFDQSMTFVETHAISPDCEANLPITTVCENGHPVDSRISLLTISSQLLALGWGYRAFRDKALIEKAHKVCDWLEAEFVNPHGGWLETVEQQADEKLIRQSAHMHLFEAFIALAVSALDTRFFDLSHKVFKLFETRLWDPESGILREYYTASWGPAPCNMRRFLLPGHYMQWIWLLSEYQGISGTDCQHYRDGLYAKGLEVGRCANTALLYEQVQEDGSVIDHSHQLWTQAEYVHASLIMAADGTVGAADNAAHTVEAMLNTFLAPAPEGGWYDSLGPDMVPTVHEMNTATLYHLFACAAALHTTPLEIQRDGDSKGDAEGAASGVPDIVELGDDDDIDEEFLALMGDDVL